MDSDKKPKRPRITTAYTPAGSDNADHENRYEKVNYPEKGAEATDQTSAEQGGYQRPYQGGYQRQNSYQNRYQNGYGQQGYQRQGYQPKAEGDEGSAASAGAEGQEGYQQGGYQRQNPYQQRQNPYQQRGYGQGGYQRPNSYGQQRQGGYQRQNSYQQRGYNQNGYQQEDGQGQHQGGYQQRGYNQRQGGYNQRQGGYQQRGYNQRQGGYKQRPGGRDLQQGGFRQHGNIKFTPRPKQIDYVLEDIDPESEIRLNKYMSNAGICSRREADEYITSGRVKINGETVTELGTKIKRSDVVEFDDKVVTPERKCYVLLNKPKDCVTTSDDPNGRLTVMDIVKNACKERIYPVGRLDRNTTGVLLLTNDGDLASKLTHPKFIKKKIYHVWTDKDISEEDMQRIADGIELEDGEIHADAISYVSDTDRNQAGIEIHSGRNRIVRRIFETLGYRVTKLDRVYFAGLTKKNLPRGRWRYLTQEEVNFLRMGAFE